ncbi:MAG: flavin reductase family protein [Cellvibrionaceae bacterium]
MSLFNTTAFRSALGQFPTGVAVVTTLDEDNNKVGMTISSFNSVSLNPPLVLWSIDKQAGCFDAFQQCTYYAINILAEQQQDVSNTFAQQNIDKFANIKHTTGNHNIPLLEDCCAVFQCKIEHRYDGGDHIIIVGRVEDFSENKKAPLVFHNGAYAELK